MLIFYYIYLRWWFCAPASHLSLSLSWMISKWPLAVVSDSLKPGLSCPLMTTVTAFPPFSTFPAFYFEHSISSVYHVQCPFHAISFFFVISWPFVCDCRSFFVNPNDRFIYVFQQAKNSKVANVDGHRSVLCIVYTVYYKTGMAPMVNRLSTLTR